MGAAAPSLPPPDVIRRTADEVIQRPYFRIDAVDDGPLLFERFLAFVKAVVTPFLNFFSGLCDVSPVLAW